MSPKSSVPQAANSVSQVLMPDTEHIIVYRHGGLFTRLVHDDNRQAEIEFEITGLDAATP